MDTGSVQGVSHHSPIIIKMKTNDKKYIIEQLESMESAFDDLRDNCNCIVETLKNEIKELESEKSEDECEICNKHKIRCFAEAMKYGGGSHCKCKEDTIQDQDVPKTFTTNEIFKIVGEWVIDFKTSWRYLKRKGYDDAIQDGDCIFLEGYGLHAIEELKSSFLKQDKDVNVAGSVRK